MKPSKACHCSRGLQIFFLPALSATLLALSFPKFNLEFLAWFAFIPIFLALENCSKVKAFLLSFICGIVFWSITISWLIHVTLLGTIVLVSYLALYFGAFGLLISSNGRGPRAKYVLFAPAIWVLLEYCRSHLLTGFPWALLGYSQYLDLPVIQCSDILGAWGVSFIVMMANGAVYSVIASRPAAHGKSKSGFGMIKMILVPAMILAGVLSYGSYKLNLKTGYQGQPSVRVAVVQGNIPQELKWYPGAREEIIEKYLYLSKLAAREKPDLIVWPEAALPTILQEESAYFGKACSLAGLERIWLLLGSVTAQGDLYYNSALLVSRQGKLADQYDKLHLVPFGEYIPLRKALPFLQTIVPIGDVARGKEFTVFKVDAAVGPQDKISSKFGVLICFEDVFPELARQFVGRGADFLVNITNDAWYKHTFAAYQHFQPSVFRAVENRVFVIRSANTGVSGFISPQGRILSLVTDGAGREIFVDGYKTGSIPVAKKGRSFYNRFGDLPIIIVCALISLFLLRRGKRNLRG
jgi:apolipoprotein N-acyltransferase